MEEKILKEYIKGNIKNKISEYEGEESKIFFSTFGYLKRTFNNSSNEDIYTIIDRQSFGSNWMSIKKRKDQLRSTINISGQYNDTDFEEIIEKLITEQIKRKEGEFNIKLDILSIIKTDTEESIMKSLEKITNIHIDRPNINITSHDRSCIFDDYHIMKAIRDNRIL